MGSSGILFAPPLAAQYRIPYGTDPHQFADLRLPDGPVPHPVVIVIHGGFWRAMYDLEHIGLLCQAITREGYATWSLEYRRLGNPGGGWPGTFQDVAAGAKRLREAADRFALDLTRVAAIGHSAGGHLALWLAGAPRVPATSPIAVANPLPLVGAVSLAGVIDLRLGYQLRLSRGVVAEFLGGSPPAVAAHYAAASPIELLPLGLRTILVHGSDDPNVPFAVSQTYYDAAKAMGDPVTLIPLPDMGHFEVIDPYSEAWSHVLRAVRLALADASGSPSPHSGRGARG